jgi:hypothetical protein
VLGSGCDASDIQAIQPEKLFSEAPGAIVVSTKECSKERMALTRGRWYEDVGLRTLEMSEHWKRA